MLPSVSRWLMMKPDLIVGEVDVMSSEMNDVPQDAEPSTRSVRFLPLYRAAIGDAIAAITNAMASLVTPVPKVVDRPNVPTDSTSICNGK
jgi:hypothetical protein